MKKHGKRLKEHIVDCIVCLTAAMLTIAIFSFYFYNVFVKFQINYAKLYNDNVLEKSSELHNDIIMVSNSLFSDSDTNAFLSSSTEMVNLEATQYIQNRISNSTIANMVSEVVISIPKTSLAYSSRLKQKYSYEDLKNLKPEYKKMIANDSKNLQTFPMGNSVAYLYRSPKGYTVCMALRASEFKNQLMEHVYPIFYGTILLNSGNEAISSNTNEDFSPILKTIRQMESDTVKIQNNFLIIKDSTTQYSAVSIIKASDILKNALNTGSFLIIISVLIFLFLGVIIYYFYFKHKKLILNHIILKNAHLDVNITHIMHKLFSRDIITAQDETALNEYFALNEGIYFMPVILGIEDYADVVADTGSDDVTMYKYGFENIICEVMSEAVSIKTVNMGKDLIGVLLYHSSPIDLEAVKNKLRYSTTVIKNNFHVELFTVIGDETEEIMSVYEQIPKLINAQSYKFIKNEAEIQLSDISKNAADVSYPAFIQTELLTHINSHNKDGFRKSLEKFADYITENEYPGGKEWFLKLFLFISENCRSNSEISIKYNTLESMLQCEKISEITDLLTDSIEYLDAPSEAEYMENENNFAGKIKKTIEEEFSNPDFCIQSITNRFGITASYFGKKFKHHFNMSFNRYLLEYRLKYAIKLLLETDYTNEKIASLCGFNSRTYFMTIFKKTIGITPKEYKNKHLNK